MRTVDVVVVGAGPAALGAAAALQRSSRDVLLIGEQRPAGWPVYLNERAQSELEALVGLLPSGRRLEGTTVRVGSRCRGIDYSTRPLVVEAETWSDYLAEALTACEHEHVPGRAHLLDADTGVLEVEHAGRRVVLRAQLVVWATGTPPPGRRRPLDLDVLVHLLPGRPAPDRLDLTLPPGDGSGRTTTQWQMPARDGAIRGTLVPRAGTSARSGTDGRTSAAGSSSTLLAHVPVTSSFEQTGSTFGRVALTGGAAGLLNRFTGEGIGYALRSGRLAGRAAREVVGARTGFTQALGAEFGSGNRRAGAPGRDQLVLRAVAGSVRSRSSARDRIVGLLLDQGVEHRVAPVRDVTSWRPAMAAARGRTQLIVARETSSLWFAAAPSLTDLPTLPDLRLSDVLLACAGPALDDPRTALTAAMIDVNASSFGLFAASVSGSDAGLDHDEPEEGRNWAEIASLTAHDLLACRALRLAGAAGPTVVEAYLLWMDTVLRLRQETLRDASPSAVLRLYESVFELPTRLAGILRGSDPDETERLVRLGHVLGAAYALGDELELLSGRRNRLGLDANQTGAHHLRCPVDEVVRRWALDPSATGPNALDVHWSAWLARDAVASDPADAEILDDLFRVGTGSRPPRSSTPLAGTTGVEAPSAGDHRS